jgi:hypothetical protein
LRASVCDHKRGDELDRHLSERDMVAQQIMQYLLEHPAAADSPAGIRDWWLRRDEGVDQDLVEEALEDLVSRNWVLAHGEKADTRVYSFNERYRVDAARFTQRREGGLNG